MKKIVQTLSFLLLAVFVVASCNNDDKKAEVTKKQVIENYANIAYANYKKAYDDAVVLKAAITTFTTTPTEANFTAAKTAWLKSRESYGTTEGFRFANGPIDNEELKGPEGYINSWPLDENYIDYTAGASTSGIINNPKLYPTIDKASLLVLNTPGTEETNVSVGYHAIEFLLWGQDLTTPSDKKAGQRPYTDYLKTGGTATNQERRATYLNVCADLLTDHLLQVVNQWKEGGSYRVTFLALKEDVAIKNMYLGITTLVSAELPVERMEVAVGNADQEDEHSCFSDNTHRDITLNLQSVINIYKGNYGAVDGASLEDLVKQANTEIYNTTDVSINSCLTKMTAILAPFDLAISGGKESVEGKKVIAAATELKTFGANLLAGAVKIGIIVNS
ncbi:imelysin family protein [Flavobacterium collinsii]|jgi:putative iron-regulated protein|uniref:Iron-regulated protein A n=1 Tax=Flavobacterium collinsii TaxID=1114861 RepID=A0ABM8KJY7_9FLAO|nr:imelysin family protein [Flavobacterium collinsii]CAA9199504.1 Iron-regulated protein A [Flavobacterium collinsii]